MPTPSVSPQRATLSVGTLDAMSPLELLRLQSEVLDELMRRDIVRSRNNPTGDYGEWIVARKLGLDGVQDITAKLID